MHNSFAHKIYVWNDVAICCDMKNQGLRVETFGVRAVQICSSLVASAASKSLFDALPTSIPRKG